MRAKTLFSLLLCGFFLVDGALAQPPQPPSRGGGGARGPRPFAQQILGEDWEKRDVHELVELVMMVRLSRELDLSEEHTVVMVRRFQEFKERLGELNKQRQQALKALKEAVKAGESDEAIQAKLDALMAVDRELLTMKQRAFEKVSSELTPTQQAKLYVFLQEFEDQMRRLIERARQARARAVGAPRREDMPRGPGRLGPHGGPGRPGGGAPFPGRGDRRGGSGRGSGEAGPQAPADAPDDER